MAAGRPGGCGAGELPVRGDAHRLRGRGRNRRRVGIRGKLYRGTASAYLALARVVFIGTALPGPVLDAGSAGAVLASPARFRVVRYLKGSGPRVVTVATALSGRGDAVTADEDGRARAAPRTAGTARR